MTLADYYGSCELGEGCLCNQPIKRTSPIESRPWLGRGCIHWKSEIPEALLKALGHEKGQEG